MDQTPPDDEKTGAIAQKTRKRRDWEELFREWIVSGLPRPDFLRSKGLNPDSGAAHKRSRGWDKRAREIALGARKTLEVIDGGAAEPVSKEVILPGEVSETPIGREATNVIPLANPSAWQIISKWREKQAATDWKDADTVRTVCKVLLKNSLKKVTDKDGRETFESTLRAHEVRQIAQTLAECQRIQRLAIGLSTENIGIDGPTDQSAGSHIEKNVTPEKPTPKFIVEMSARGKFLRPRPRRVE